MSLSSSRTPCQIITPVPPAGVPSLCAFATPLPSVRSTNSLTASLSTGGVAVKARKALTVTPKGCAPLSQTRCSCCTANAASRANNGAAKEVPIRSSHSPAGVSPQTPKPGADWYAAVALPPFAEKSGLGLSHSPGPTRQKGLGHPASVTIPAALRRATRDPQVKELKLLAHGPSAHPGLLKWRG